MLVTGVNVDMLEIPFRVPIVSGAERWERRGVGIISISGDDGNSGLGELAAAAGERIEGVATALSMALADLDLAEPIAVEAALQSIDAWPVVGRAARAAVESALVDLLARSSNTSVALSLSAASRADVAVNGMLGISEPEVAAARAADLVAAGFSSLKLKAAREPGSALVDRLSAVRDAVGSDVELRVDFNGSLSPDTADAVLAQVAQFDLEYAEQPLPASAGAEALARLRWVGTVPIAVDESVCDLGSTRVLLDTGAVDALVVKPARVGGLRQARSIIDLATAASVPVTVSTLFETGVGIAGALHLAAMAPGVHAHGLATADLLDSDLLLEPLPITGGRMDVPNGPGLGVELDVAAIERYRVA